MIRGCIEFLRADNRCWADGDVKAPIEPLRLAEDEGVVGPYGICLAKMLEPMCEVGMRSALRGRETSGLRQKLGGRRAAMSAPLSTTGSGVGTGEKGRAIAFAMNFLWTYLSIIHFSRDSLSELESGFCLVGGMEASNT